MKYVIHFVHNALVPTLITVRNVLIMPRLIFTIKEKLKLAILNVRKDIQAL